MTSHLPTTEATNTLDELYARAERLELTPGWIERREPLFWPQPRSEHVPALWRFQDARDALDVAGQVIDVELAERRNLLLRNPFPGNDFTTLRTFACAYQMILPGENARSHRHSPHALRVIIEARGTYSVVNGTKIPMETGDVILTPGGDWHGHGHDGSEPAYWLDALDLPLVQLLEPMFYEEHPDGYEPVARQVSTSPYRFAADQIEARLDEAEADPRRRGVPRISLPAPDMPSMGLTVERLPAGTSTPVQRSTANRVFVAMSGTGTTTINGHRYEWTRGDTLAVPLWTEFSHQASQDATLFCVSDEPTMRALAFLRVPKV